MTDTQPGHEQSEEVASGARTVLDIELFRSTPTEPYVGDEPLSGTYHRGENRA